MNCLPGDSCTAGGKHLYSLDLLASDEGQHADGASYLLGKSLAPLVTTGTFMLQVKNVTSTTKASVMYPLNAETRKFLEGNAFYESDPLITTLIDYDGGVVTKRLRLCNAANHSSGARTFQGAEGLRIMAIDSAKPSETASIACDYGAGAQIRVQRQPSQGLEQIWGAPPTTAWKGQQFSHAIFIREKAPATINIVSTGPQRLWADGTFARTCNDYRQLATGARGYTGEIGDQLYSIKPDDATAAFEAFCEMATDDGGWTLLAKTVLKDLTPSEKEQIWKGNWATYTDLGYGDPRAASRMYWMPLKNWHLITRGNPGGVLWSRTSASPVRVTQFKVMDLVSKYAWTWASPVQGSLGILDKLKGVKFTTQDMDNDDWAGGNCSSGNTGANDGFNGGFWYAAQCGQLSMLHDNGMLYAWSDDILTPVDFNEIYFR